MRALGPILLVLIVYSLWSTVYILQLRRRLAGLKDWRAWLPRKQRKQYAIEQMQDALEEQDLAHSREYMGIIRPPIPKEFQ